MKKGTEETEAVGLPSRLWADVKLEQLPRELLRTASARPSGPQKLQAPSVKV